jgi:predicted nucleic acid-binding protein
VTYLDTGCLVKLYYPEPDSPKVVARVQGQPLAYTELHELEFVNALQLKVFFHSATPNQVAAARGLVESDLETGVLTAARLDWGDVFAEATRLASQHSAVIGCRSLDILHCAAAKLLNATEFISADARQKKLADASGLNVVNL